MILKDSNKNWLIQQSENHPNLIAVHDGVQSFTYSELLKKVAVRINTFIALGMTEGMNIALLGFNTVEYIINIYALWLLNAIPVPLNIRLTQREIKQLILHSESKFVLFEYRHKDLISGSNAFSFDNIMQMDDDDAAVPSSALSKIAAIIYTSGTEGTEKGVPISFTNLYNSTAAINAIDNYTCKDKFLVSLPLYHIGGFSIIIRSLLCGGSLILPGIINSDNIIKYTLGSEPTIISLVPTMLNRLIDENIKPPASLRAAYIGGGPSDESLIIQAIKLGYPVVKVYGSTETCAMITYLSTGDARIKPRSSGKPLPNTTINIVDSDGLTNSSNTSGEIIVESNSLFNGYFKNNELTTKRLKDEIYYTGDIGYIDNDDYLFVESRREDLIVTGGENVIPSEIEEVIRSHEAVNDACVFGIDDEKWGQVICAAVVIDKKYQKSLTEFLKPILPKYKLPKKIIFLKELPYNNIGKVNIEKLKQLIKLNESSNNF